LPTSDNFFFEDGLPEGSCHSNFSATIGGITATYNDFAAATVLTFTGKITGGTVSAFMFGFCHFGHCDAFGDAFFSAPFTGVWSNGWHSTGDLFGGGAQFVNFVHPAPATLLITTEETPIPEPSTFMMLGAGLLPVIGVIRRRYLNR
jgi:hypothetical protein